MKIIKLLITLIALMVVALLLGGCDYTDYAFSTTPAYDAAATQGLVPQVITGTRTPTAVWDVVTSPDLYTQQDQAAATLAAVNQQMTATQQSAMLTQQAAAFEATQAADAVRSTSTAQAWAITAEYQAQSATQTAQVEATRQSLVVEATRQSLDVTATQQTIDLERAELTNQAWAVVPLVLVGLLAAVVMGLGAWAVVEIVRAVRNRQAVVQLPNGGALVVTERRMSVLKTDVMTAPEHTMATDGNEPISEQTRLTLAMAQQQTEIQRAYAAAGARPRGERSGSRSNEAKAAEMTWPPAAIWPPAGDLNNGLMLGMTTSGPMTARIDSDPHLLIAGTSGSGKTRYMLRPLIAQALVAGWAVAIIDRTGLDFYVFERHVNCHQLILGTNPTQAIGALRATYAEVLRRMQMMTEARVSTWAEMEGYGAQVMIVLDEFSNLADSMGAAEREALWQAARMVAAEGRKSGVHLVLALQDPTAESLDLRIRRNTAQVAFRVRDGSASRVVINAGGAEGLGHRQFLAVVGGRLQAGLAYAPSDADIEAYLNQNPVLPMQMLDLTAVALPVGQDGETIKLAEQIREAWQRGESKRGMARLMGQNYAGSFASRIDRAIDYLVATTATADSEG